MLYVGEDETVKEFLEKLDMVGFALITATVIGYSIHEVWNLYLIIGGITGVCFVLISMSAKFQKIRVWFTRRSTGLGINSGVSVILVIGILAVINYLGAHNQQRLDFTTDKIYSLAEQSATVAGQVDQAIKISAFYPGGDDFPARDLLSLYASRNSRISFEFIDPDRKPQLAQQFDVSVYGDFSNPLSGQVFSFGTLVFEMGERVERIEKQSEPLREEDVTNALMKLLKGEQKMIYFIEGHGEKLVMETERAGMSKARTALEREGYATDRLNLVREAGVPGNAAVLIWPGPQTEPFPEEIELVEAYLNQGGSVFLMLDPPPSSSLDALLNSWSIKAGDNFVVDASGVGRLLGAGPEIPLVSQYGEHAITERFNVMTFFPLVRSVSLSDGADGTLDTTELLTTGAQSWGESNMESGEASFDSSADISGPVTIGVVITKNLAADEKARFVVFGDADFATNSFFDLQGNGSLFLNTVSWLAEDESFISVRPKVPRDRRLTLTQAQGRITYYVSLFLLPLSILGVGISVWIKRRDM